MKPHVLPLDRARTLARVLCACSLVWFSACDCHDASNSAPKPAPATSAEPASGANAGRAPAAGADGNADTLTRERGAAFFLKGQKELARKQLAALVERKDAVADDLIHAAAIEFADGKIDASEAFLARATKLDPTSAALAYLRGQIAREAGDYKAALPLFSAANAAAPGDLPTRLALAETNVELGDLEAAEALYRSVIDVGIENGGPWYVAAVFRMARLLTENNRAAEAEPYNAIFLGLQKRGIASPDALTMSLGNLGRVPPPPPQARAVDKPAALAAFTLKPAVLPELAGATQLEAQDLDGDVHLDLLASGTRGIFAGLWRAEGWTPVTISTEAATLVRAFDLDNDNDLDLIALQGDKLVVYVAAKDAWTATKIELPALPSVPSDICAVDYDHEGDLDLLLVGAFGARIWRNDGAATPDKGGKYVDATDVAALPTDKAFDWCLTEDLDADNDVDFLLGGREHLFLADSLRAGKFADKTSKVFEAGTRIATRPLAADLDGDARVDLWTDDALWLQQRDNSLRKSPRAANAAKLGPDPIAIDVDLDGALDGVSRNAQRALPILLALGTPAESAANVGEPARGCSGALASGDFDGDGTIDIACSAQEGIHLLSGAKTSNVGALLSFNGLRDNRRAVGATVEVRAGPIYRRIYWRTNPARVGLGRRDKTDVLRITWPNGTVQTELDLALTEQGWLDHPDATSGTIAQKASQSGSCPFLYTWNGERFTFVTDVIGSNPLGLPIAPDMLVPPDHDEYVLVRGDQLKPKDGFYELAFTEELREVTYLDHARLHVIDHPQGTTIQPNERFTFPPFPEAHTHTFRDPLTATKATGSDGKDWTNALAQADDVHAKPFVLEAPQFAGLAKPWFVELEFDRARVARASKLRLVLTGWFYWSDASANMASARQPGVAFIPPMFQVPDGKGGWRGAGPPVGFPAGKTKTMVLDVGAILDRNDPRIRVFSTLRLYWDQIQLAVDDDDAPLDERVLEPMSANLWRRGFSGPLHAASSGSSDPSRSSDLSGSSDPSANVADASDQPERFDWDWLAPLPRWNQHPGLYTRYGETLPLVTTVDDRFVILGAGDALTVRFDARSLPAPKPGFVRDYLVYLDGWAKDRDPNSLQALEVEPLPFHAMSGYPYRPDEKFPDDEAHAQWRREWNTRPAHAWIEPVSLVRKVETRSND